jgi:hypothetical protein
MMRTQVSPVAAALISNLETDPELSIKFKKCRATKHRQLTDLETLQNYRFALDIRERWYTRMIDVQVRWLLGISLPLMSSHRAPSNQSG